MSNGLECRVALNIYLTVDTFELFQAHVVIQTYRRDEHNAQCIKRGDMYVGDAGVNSYDIYMYDTHYYSRGLEF